MYIVSSYDFNNKSSATTMKRYSPVPKIGGGGERGVLIKGGSPTDNLNINNLNINKWWEVQIKVRV